LQYRGLIFFSFSNGLRLGDFHLSLALHFQVKATLLPAPCFGDFHPRSALLCQVKVTLLPCTIPWGTSGGSHLLVITAS